MTHPRHHAANMQCETFRLDLSHLRIRRTELEQQDPQHPALQALDAAIRTREQQLARAAAGVAYPGDTSRRGSRWQVRVVAKHGGTMVDWRKMHAPRIDPATDQFVPAGEGFLAWRKLFEHVKYIAWPEDTSCAWSLAREEPKTLAEWQELFARVDLDVEDMDQDLNVIQQAGAISDDGTRVIEVGAMAEEMQRDPGMRARCTLAEQRQVLGPQGTT
jgi:hypothetical protein